jgi:hypothetical protein
MRFLQPDRLAIRAEILRVIERDAGDDGTVGVDGVDSVVAAAESDFEDHHIQRRVCQQVCDGQGGEFEFGQRDVTARGFDRGKVRQQRLGRDRASADAASLLEVHQLGLLVGADAPARRQRDRLQHGAGRALAVGSGDGDHRYVELQIESLQDLDRSLERQVHRDRVPALAVREPVAECLWRHATASALWRVSIANERAITLRNWRLSTIMSSAPLPIRNSLR